MRPWFTGFLTCVVAGAVLTSILSATGCRPKDPRYALRGQVVRKNLDTNQITVKNEDIPGFMPPMTMSYKVQDPSVLQKVEAGDVIAAELVTKKNGSEYWLERIQVVSSKAQKK
jgi:protein SCO1